MKPDRKKVIEGLEEVIAEAVYPDRPRKFMMSLELAEDALALLKAQEPCEDAVSRKDVINVLQSPCDMRYVNGNWHPCIGDYIEAITNLSAVAPKAQEPVSVQKKQMEMAGLQTWDWACGNCGQTVLFSARFCPWCGRAVKWE